MAIQRTDKRDELSDLLRLYEQYGRPLESEHRGKFLAVSSEGETILDDDYDSLFRRASEAFGVDIAFFKVGEVAVGNLRWSSL